MKEERLGENLREDIHKKMFFLMVGPLRRGGRKTTQKKRRRKKLYDFKKSKILMTYIRKKKFACYVQC